MHSFLQKNKFNLPILILIVIGLLVGCQSIENYQEQNDPVFEASYSDGAPQFDGQIKVITWNIKFSEEIEAAIGELSKVEELQGADIILLQEMDEASVDTISQTLKYNYVYYPASIHSHHSKNFGNAILSKWPLSNPKKLILPHQNPRNNQIRIATQALVTIDDIEIPAYSVHTETVWLSPGKRTEQILTIVKDMESMSDYALVGGDFNTITPQSVANLDNRFDQIGLTRVSAGAGHTFERGGLNFTMDHIYAKEMSPLANGVWADTRASDHYPVWAELTIN